ncbi:MAG: polysaccharide deacetylase [Cellulosilyticum sp.]|nr:polysaccharide deacetylase [Cellulosilyticum sp.]
MKTILKWLMILGCCIGLFYGCIYAQEEHTQSSRILYLTFDDGPSEYTNELLDLLNKHHMKATFFMLDAEMQRNPEVVKRMINEGHAVGVHGVTHEKETFYCGVFGPVKEMDQANDTLQSISGQRTVLARTPYGSSPYLTKKQREALDSRHYILWDWNIDSRDWSYRNPQKTFNHTIKDLGKMQKDPKVILFHDIKSVIETMTLFIDWMEQNDYTSEAITSDLIPVKLWSKSKS